MKKLSTFLMLGVLLAAQGCTSVRYYSQVTRGHLDLMSRRVPIAEVLEDPETDETLKIRLKNVLVARDFAVQELKLPDNDSYRMYADLERPFVLWNVFATEEFSTQATTWCYLFVGCLGYRGYYSQDEANEVAANLNTDGYDAFVGGVPAYSTLGRFDDPVLNTMLRRGDVELAGLLFHELTHQVVYRNSDSEFSESLASFVEMEGVRRWLIKNDDQELIARYELAQQREEEFVAVVTRARDRLTALYEVSMPQDEMRLAKAEEFEQLQLDYVELKDSWGGYAGYDGWFGRELNNSHLVSISTYNRLVPAFAELLRESDGRFDIFFERSQALAELEADELKVQMDRLLGLTAEPVSD
ncbi:MAG: aminopeptidase [Gammaproteobacteria bacterium]